MEGKVWLVGAGPGDEGLLTLKAEKVLRDADLILYDHLVGENIILKYGTGKELIHVGKTAGHHPVPQKEINRILAEEAGKGKRVVRLKGGDPFLFGRGGEELEELFRLGIPFEVVPGVTSPLAVPAYNGIPVTHRDYASSLHIVTGHAGCGKESRIPYRELVQAGGTLVFLMGVTALEEIMEGLLSAGMSPDTPAAILQEGTTAGQKKVIATAGTLAEKALQAGVRPPALIVAGEVCRLSDRLSWYEKLPLSGMRIFLTRPKELISSMADKLREKGAQVLEIPTVEIEPVEDDRMLLKSLKEIADYDWIVFTSQAGVRIFFEKMQEYRMDIRSLCHAKFAVIGEGTEKALKLRGIFADVMPEVYDGVSLGRALAGAGIGGKRILLPRAKKANQNLVPILKEAGADVLDLPIYHTVYREPPEIPVSIAEEIESGRTVCAAFTSSSTVEGFVRAAAGADLSKVRAVCIGRQTAETAEQYGMKCYISDQATIDSLLAAVEAMNRCLSAELTERMRSKSRFFELVKEESRKDMPEKMEKEMEKKYQRARRKSLKRGKGELTLEAFLEKEEAECGKVERPLMWGLWKISEFGVKERLEWIERKRNEKNHDS